MPFKMNKECKSEVVDNVGSTKKDGQMDGKMLPYILSPCYAVDKNMETSRQMFTTFSSSLRISTASSRVLKTIHGRPSCQESTLCLGQVHWIPITLVFYYSSLTLKTDSRNWVSV